jgi:cytochrome b
MNTTVEDRLGQHDKLHLLLLFMMQISEVVNSLKDLIDHSRETGTGPMGKLMVYMVDSSYASRVMNGSIK